MISGVVLVVYGWKSVEPGTLAWVFPSVAAATHAAHAMTNAVRWAVIRASAALTTKDAPDLASARAHGDVLVDHPG